MEPEEEARQKIDVLLQNAGWVVQDYRDLNLAASVGVAVREFPLKSGFADYLLFVDGLAAGVLEAKPEGTTLSGVAVQSDGYLVSLPDKIPRIHDPIPFAYESTGIETMFRDIRDPDSKSRSVFSFHKPEMLREWASQSDTLRARLKEMPPLEKSRLWNCQVEAIQNLEQSFAADRPRALIQMATGSGKTYTAVSFVYRLIKYAGAKRILFLVDRRTLGKQAFNEFQQYVTPDDGRKLTELYNVQHMSSNSLDPVCRVCITTIQRLYSMLKGDEEFDPELEEESLFNNPPKFKKPVEVSYNPKMPIESFDFIITDECHRSIYNLWRQVLEYFDSFLIGLTATPYAQTIGFFKQNLVMEYNHQRAVADNVNVDYEIYRIKTQIGEGGGKVDAGFYVDKRDRQTRKVRWEMLENDFEYAAKQLDRDVVAPDQIRTIIRTFRDKLFTEIFPKRTEVPKTLVFAKTDSHAEDIVNVIREEFGRGNDFCKKITYRTTGEKPDDLISQFRNSYYPRIAVTVDMISTGTDVKPIECLLFMRDVRSSGYFEQMKGRGTRVISDDDYRQVVPDALKKEGFVIVDAVGVCESEKNDSFSLERKRTISFEKLIQSVAIGVRDEDTLSSLAGRLARLNKGLTDSDRKEIEEAAPGTDIKKIVEDLIEAIDYDAQVEKAKVKFKVENPTPEQVDKIYEEMAKDACAPFNNPKLRNIIVDIKKRNEQIIDTVSKDEIIFAGPDESANAGARKTVADFKKFIEDNKDELTAFQIIYSTPYSKRHITFEEIKKLADAIKKPPYYLTPEKVWNAYERLEKSKVRGVGPQKLLTNIISLVRFASGEKDVLEPFPMDIERRFQNWLEYQKAKNKNFTSEQMEWLSMIKEQIATSIEVSIDDFEDPPFYGKGGPIKAQKLFGPELNPILHDLNDFLIRPK